jgi:hypothetical protein
MSGYFILRPETGKSIEDFSNKLRVFPNPLLREKQPPFGILPILIEF